ncbi:MAG: ABC transporter substrate-binding protein [Spirochaetota bacterium]
MKRSMKALAIALALLVVGATGLMASGTQESGEGSLPGPIIVGSNSAPRTLNPLFFPSRQDSVVTNMIFENFVQPDKEGQIVGRLVESFDISDDGLTYTFNLRDDVTWHDGEQFNAEDVVATFEMLAHPDYNGGMNRVGDIVGVEEFAEDPSGDIPGVTVEDDYTVVVEIKEPSATFLPGLYFPILPAHEIADIDLTNLEEAPFNSNPVGTGPFVFEEWAVGDSITVTANEDYYLGAPKVSSVIVEFGDTVALTSQLQTGAIDILEVDLDGYATFEGDSDYVIYTYPMLSVDYVGYRVGPGRADDTDDWLPVYEKNIRQALAYATNKEALVDAAFGVGGYPHDSIFPRGTIADSPNDNEYAYDLNRAKALIEAEGYEMNDQTDIYERDGEPLAIELIYSEADGAAAAILKEQWSQAGVDLELRLLDFGALINVLLRKSDANGNLEGDDGYDPETAATDSPFEAYLLGFAQESDPDEYAQYFVDDPFWNFYHYENEDVQRWFEEQAVTVDPDERQEILHRISEQITEDLPWFTYAGTNENVVTGANIGGFDPDTRGYTLNAHLWTIE